MERRVEGEDGGVALVAVGIALDGNVEDAEAALGGMADFAGEEDGSGAGAEDGLAAGVVLKSVEEVVAVEEFEHSGGFAAGQDEAVETGEGFGGFDQRGSCAGFFEGGCVALVVALEGEDADTRGTGMSQGAFLLEDDAADRGFSLF